LSERRPSLSIVIAATDSPAAVARALASLGNETRDDLERIVASEMAQGGIEGVRWVRGAPGCGVPHLRRLGLDQARGAVVVFTEDSCVFPRGWTDQFLDAFADERLTVASGPVLPALGARAIDWAVFFCEYAAFLPRASNPETRLAGNNFAIRRDLASALDREAIHESDVACMTVAGSRWVERAEVWHVRRYGFAEAMRDRLRFGFDYGLRRGRTMSWARRMAGLGAGPAILAIQAARLTLGLCARPRYLDVFAETLPLTLALLTAWSVGEWLGWSRAALGGLLSRR
jgi:hypothetical protein